MSAEAPKAQSPCRVEQTGAEQEKEKSDAEVVEATGKQEGDEARAEQQEAEASQEGDEEEEGGGAKGGGAGRRASLHHTASPLRVQRNGAGSHSATSDYELSLDLKNKQVGLCWARGRAEGSCVGRRAACVINVLWSDILSCFLCKEEAFCCDSRLLMGFFTFVCHPDLSL